MTKRLVMMLVLAVASSGQESKEDVSRKSRKVSLPIVARSAVRLNDPPTQHKVTITLTGDGEIVADRPGDPISLFGLGYFLTEAKVQYSRVAIARGRKWEEPVESSLGKVAVMKQWLICRADETAPWRHVQWIGFVAHELRYWRVCLGVRAQDDKLNQPTFREYALRVPLTKNFVLEKGEKALEIEVSVITRKTAKATKAVYRCGSNAVPPDKLQEVVKRTVVTMRKEFGHEPLIELHATASVSVRQAIVALEAIHLAGATRVWWLPEEVPGIATRKKLKLPNPESR